MSSGLVYPNPSPWPPGELDVEIKSKSRQGVEWGGGSPQMQSWSPGGEADILNCCLLGIPGHLESYLKNIPEKSPSQLVDKSHHQ